MSDETGYNGWTNYETWNVALWMGNDQGIYYDVRELVVNTFGQVTEPRWDFETLEDARVSELADVMKDFIEELAEMTCPGVIEGASFVSDLFGAALSSVDWREIASHYVDEYEDQPDDEDAMI